MSKPSLKNDSSGRDMGVHTFPKSISSRVKEIPWLEFELVYYDIIVQHISHYVTKAPLLDLY